MIQRIQSIYLLLAGIIPAFAFCLPLVCFGNGEHDFNMTAGNIHSETGEIISYTWGVIFFTILCIALPLIAIFQYRNRILQIKLANAQIVCLLLLYITAGTYAYVFTGHENASIQSVLGFLLPLFSLIFTILGRRAICRDEALVRAADRIR